MQAHGPELYGLELDDVPARGYGSEPINSAARPARA